MNGFLQFCYKPLLSSTAFNLPANASFRVWYNGDFGLCFEYLVFMLSLSAFFGLTSALYAGLKYTSIRRRKKPLVLIIRAILAFCIVVNSFVEFIAAFWLAKGRPYSVLLAQIVMFFSWSVHLWCIKVLSSSVTHVGRGPLTLNAAWFFTLVGCVIHLRSVIRWKVHPGEYSLSDGSAYFDLLLQITTYVYFGLQCLYGITLIFKAKPVSGDDIELPRSLTRKLHSGSTQEEEEALVKPQLVTSKWQTADESTDYGSISLNGLRTRGGISPSKLEASEDRANILSLLSFWWLQPLMRKGALGLLQKPEDLLQLPKTLRTEVVRERFQKVLQRYREPYHSSLHFEDDGSSSSAAAANLSEHTGNAMHEEVALSENTALLESLTHSTRKSKPTKPQEKVPNTSSQRSSSNVSLFWSLNLAFGWHYYPLGLLKLAADILGFAGPLLLHALVAFIENKTEPMANGYYYALGLILSTFLTAILNTHFNYQVSKVGLKIRAALITEIYRKALSVSTTTLSKFSTGQVVNFMSTDTDRIVNFGQSFHQFWSLPFQIAVSLYLLHQQVGLAFLAGLGFSILLVPINRWLAVKIGKLSTEMMEWKDERVQLMTEVLVGIRVIKFYAWERNFTKKVLGLRAGELKSLKGRKYLDALCVYFWATTPVLISILTFTTYVALGNKLTAAKVFTSVALFSILISPLNAFPWVLNGLVEAWVSIKRVRKFLQLEELDLRQYYVTYKCQEQQADNSQKSAVSIREGCFTWRREEDSESQSNESGDTGQTGQTGPMSASQLAPDSSVSGQDQGDDRLPSLSAVAAREWTLSDINLNIEPGQLIGVIGKVGSGKTSLLAAITAEMRKKHGQVYVANLAEGFGLATQEAWIQHATVQENVVFGQHFDSEKYNAVVFACALEQDLQILPAGDQTEVGENGVTLSGGQKARLALARAVYQDKDIYLLDDPLAAVDAHVASHLFSHCIMGLLRHKTRVLCTHHIRFLYEADVVIVMEHGAIACSGPPSLVLPQIEEQLLKREEEQEDNGEGKGVNEKQAEAKEFPSEQGSCNTQPAQEVEHVLVKEEEKEVGVVAFNVYWAYWSSMGNILALLILLSLLLMQASRNISDWWLAYWISHTQRDLSLGSNISAFNITPSEELYPHYEHIYSHSADLLWVTGASGDENASIPELPLSSASDNLAFYLGIYGGLAVANSVFTLLRAFLYAYGGIRAATVLHKKLLQSILRAPVSFFDVTPIGRIVNRFSSDLYAIDDSLPFIMNILLAQFYGLLGTIAVTCYGLPWFTLLLVPLGVLYYNIQKYYRRTSRELKRLSTVTLSPVYAHFSESLAGLWLIRALRASDRFIAENETRLEVNQRANFGSYAVAQWLGIRLQMLGVAMVAGVSFIAVLEHHFNSVDPGLVGLAISYALSVTNLLSGVVTSFTETEKQMVSVERAMQYIQRAPAEKEQGSREPPTRWPSEGVVEFRRVILIYREGLPPALNEVSFITRPAEKIGVVGRTGAGKSSLFQALFRMVELNRGVVFVDGIDISTLPLEELRSVMAVIPQDPFLFSGSIRENLDPCGVHSDHELLCVLERCHLRVAVMDLGGLDAEVGDRGREFSMGQRQLVCLARALLTQAKVICIDEATANVDLHTDVQIQQTIRSEFTGSTVITIAHRIETVLNSDRILVMEQGQVREFRSPAQLLDNPDSLFSALFREHSK